MKTVIISLVNNKGGVSKSITAINLAAFLQRLKPTLLIDGDPNRSIMRCAQHGHLPCKAVTEKQSARIESGEYHYKVIDTASKLSDDDMSDIIEISDLIIVPTPPAGMSLAPTLDTLYTLRKMNCRSFAALLTIVPPPPNTNATEARLKLLEDGYPVFETEIKRLIAFEYAWDNGVPVYAIKDARAQIAWHCIERLGAEILSREGLKFQTNGEQHK